MTIAAPAAPLREAIAEAFGPLQAATPTAEGARLLSVSVEIAEMDPLALFEVATEEDSEPCLWLQPDRGLALVGVGEAWSVRASGASRFEEVAMAWTALLDGARLGAQRGPRGSGPLLLGGFGFASEPATAPEWRGFEAASLICPTLLLTSTGESTWLTVSLLATPSVPADESLLGVIERWERLADRVADRAIDGRSATTLRVRRNRPEAPEWRDSVARLAGAVGRGRVDKVVLSRQVGLAAATPIDVAGLLRRLSRSAPESTLFAVTRASRTFLGATPERLVSVAAREFSTMAMAGSTRRAGDVETDAALGAELLQSDKEREEHAVVVAMLRDALGPLAEPLHVASRPHVVQLRHVQHLVTSISGRLREDAGVLALVARLHPTPAVGGAPLELALELIADEERHQRGWYAGPLGWVDADGDGEFVVALRSGVIDGDEATLFAGCGIMADSDPEREWEESSTKLLLLASELGRLGP